MGMILTVEVHVARHHDVVSDRLAALWPEVEQATHQVLASVSLAELAKGSAEAVEPV